MGVSAVGGGTGVSSGRGDHTGAGAVGGRQGEPTLRAGVGRGLAPLTWRQEGWGSGDTPCPSGSVKPGLFFEASQAAAETPRPQKALVRAAGGEVPSGGLGDPEVSGNAQGYALRLLISCEQHVESGRPTRDLPRGWSPALPAVETGSGQPFPDGSALGAGPWAGVGEPRGGDGQREM